MKDDRDAQEIWQQSHQRVHRNQAAIVFQEEARRQIYVPAPNPRLIAVWGELSIAVVETQLPLLALDLRGYTAERLQDFQQTDIVLAFTLRDAQRVVGRRGINRDTLLLRSGRRDSQQPASRQHEANPAHKW